MIKLKPLTVFALAAPLLAGAVSIASAAPITLRIPVNLSNLHPDVTHFSVFCRILNAGGRNVTSARTMSVVPITSGGYSGMVTVEGGMDPSVVADAHSYKCFLQFGIQGVAAVHTPAPVPGERYNETPYTEERMEHDTAAPFRHYIEGTF